MIALWTSLALAAPPCGDVQVLLDQARGAFEDAEVEQARNLVTGANQALSCQTSVVSRETLLELYHLDALISVAQEDSKGGLYAVIRAVTVDPTVRPPSDVGAELIERHRQWADRLSADVAVVRATDDVSDVWIDGVALNGAVECIAGEHYVQTRTGDTWWSGVVELAASKPTRSLPLNVSLPEADVVVPPVTPDHVRRGGRVRPGVAAVGLTLLTAGAGLLTAGYVSEESFKANPYADEEYGGCQKSDSCWTDERSVQIGRDADRTNALYSVGYGMSGIGAGIIGMELLVAPRKTGGATIGLRGRW
ncbi:MAG: hypothetical protein ACI9MC_001661 [Kiritimatiellia bacterium]|jgi:hypothetical protein